LLAVGAVIFLAGYAVYGFFLGGIDGLAPLPTALQPPTTEVKPIDPVTFDSDIDKKLRMAFGNECPQVKKSHKFEVRKKGMVVAAAETSFKEPDGRLKLTDCSVAIFKEHPDGKPGVEINTITSDQAFLTFEEKITSPVDLNKSKLMGGELRGHVTIINNRRTPEKSDDLEVLVDGEPLFYEEKAGRIWTNGFVKLIDKQTKPAPTKISGHGMELLLARDQPSDKKQPPQTRVKSDLSGVDRITLKSTVEMHLYPEAGGGFPGGSTRPQPDKKAEMPGKILMDGKEVAQVAPAPERCHVVIRTYGPFVYDLTKDVARFDSPPAQPNQAFPDQVEVLRELLRDEADPKGGEHLDQLLCDHLTLYFRRRTDPGPARDDKAGNDREIEKAHAECRPGMEVVLSLDSENLACHCLDLTYECPTTERGSRTTLKGKPLEAVKDGHRIKARELVLISSNVKGVNPQMTAMGPGQVDLYDRNPGKGYTTHALWKGLLTSEKFKEGQRDLDLLTLTEDAAFIDDEHDQRLFGQRLQVWLESSDTPAKAIPQGPGQEAPVGGARQRPVKVEAYERVKAESPELRINDCTTLKIRFHDVRPTELLPDVGPPPAPLDVKIDLRPPLVEARGTPPQAGEAPGAGGKVIDTRGTPAPGMDVRGSPPVLAEAPGAAPDAPGGQEKAKEKPKPPIDLRARDVVADVLRTGEKNELKELVAIGAVHVHQDGETPEDKGVDIKGETLNLLHFIEGDILKVYGDSRSGPAQLQLGELFLLGPKVFINQKENTANIEGVGAMRMPSKTTFDGGKPTKPGTNLTVEWTQKMLFNGRDADFCGGVVAYQDDSTLRCQTLQVALDRTVSLKAGQKGDQPAKVEKVIAHNKVWVLDIVKDEKEKEKDVSQRLLTCQQVLVDNTENRVNATGPGTVSTLQYGAADGGNGSGPKQPKGAPAKAPELMLTRVDYQDRMFSMMQNPETRKSTFLGNVQVIYVPADSLDAKVDPAKLPKGGMLLRCDMLTVIGQQGQGPNAKSAQEMEAKTRVFCQHADMTALAETAKFNEAQDTITFYGSPGNPAVVYQQIGGPGGKRKETRARLIQYNRKDGTIQADGIEGINGALPMEERFLAADGFEVDPERQHSAARRSAPMCIRAYRGSFFGANDCSSS
jgi:hypothetical protein